MCHGVFNRRLPLQAACSNFCCNHFSPIYRPCSACTYENAIQFDTCKICQTSRYAGSSSAAIASSTPSYVNGNSNISMTPTILKQKWKSYGSQAVSTSVTTFTQPSIHIFSNYITHPPLSFTIPTYCNSTQLVASGRNAVLNFTFSEMAIMACKAALFKDFVTFDAILACRDSRQAKSLGRQVQNFNQHIWDKNQCSIVKDVTIAKLEWDAFKQALVQTNDHIIVECDPGDWVWGCALHANDSNVYYPARWKVSLLTTVFFTSYVLC